jgi:putative restriction endonuclease
MFPDGQRVRLAAFAFLTEQTQLHGEVLPRDQLAAGFQLDGQRVPLMGPQGIFKPACSNSRSASLPYRP